MSDERPDAAAEDEAPFDLPPWQRRLIDDRSAIIPLVPVAPGAKEPAPKGLTDQPAKSGILVVDKPKGRSSHDVVQAIRRASGERRVGHAGTLDPLATGVLVLCIGSATRVVDDIQALPKIYGAELRLGQETETQDAEGPVTSERDWAGVTREQVEAALAAFRGDILQVPPMHSALHHEGKRLYELAREGKEVERAPRALRVDRLELVAFAPPFLRLEMQVSKGFYVRSLAFDLGRALGCGAHLSGLVRLAVGQFRLEDAEPLPRAVEAFVEGWWPTILHPLDAALEQLPALIVDADGERELRFGRQVPAGAEGRGQPGMVRAYGPEGRFIGLVEWDEAHGAWQPAKIFPSAAAAPKMDAGA